MRLKSWVAVKNIFLYLDVVNELNQCYVNIEDEELGSIQDWGTNENSSIKLPSPGLNSPRLWLPA